MTAVPEDDVEASPAWLAGLRALNEVIAAVGEPLWGNLCYEDLRDDYLDEPPSPLTRPKRDRFRAALEGSKRMLEIGVNGGHSAYLVLTANPALEFHGVDICEHGYVQPAMEHLAKVFPGRVFLHAGDSRRVVPALGRQGLVFDAFHIDGAKQLYFADLLNCDRLIDGDEATVIVDDTQLKSVAWTWRTCERHGVVEENPDVPPLRGFRETNVVGRMRPIPGWKWTTLFHSYAKIPPVVSPAVARLKQAKAIAARS